MNGAFVANSIARYRENLACQMCDSIDDCDKACTYQTRISYDKGHTWQPLKVPEDDPICGGETSEDCSLHLHLDATDEETHGNLVSHEKSPGVILSAGNTGRKLGLEDEAVDLYLSRDAGASWRCCPL